MKITDDKGDVIRTEDLVKIIRAQDLMLGDKDTFVWNYSENENVENDWGKATLKDVLNDDNAGYYASKTTSYYEVGKFNPVEVELDFENKGLSDTVKDKIESVLWNIGKHDNYSIVLDEFYAQEISDASPKWSGKIALMNVSDYGYASDLSECKNADGSSQTCNWLYDSSKQYWTLNIYTGYTYTVFKIENNVSYFGYTHEPYNIKPTLYLKSNLNIKEIKTATINGVETSYYVVE